MTAPNVSIIWINVYTIELSPFYFHLGYHRNYISVICHMICIFSNPTYPNDNMWRENSIQMIITYFEFGLPNNIFFAFYLL